MNNYLRELYYIYDFTKHAHWPRNKLREYQDKKLRRIVKYAYEYAPFYNSRFRAAGITPSEIKTAADLTKLPILSKDEVKNNLDQIISTKYDVSKLKSYSTSGSTGKPLQGYINRKEDAHRRSKHLRANISIGQRPRDKWVTLISPRAQVASRLQRLLGFFVPTPISVFNDVVTQISLIAELKPDILDGYSNSLLLLAREVEKRGIVSIKPRSILGGAESIEYSSRQFIEKVFDAPFYDQYACDEMARIAWQCKEKNEYHIDADSVIVQFVDGDGEEVSSGERGQIVCTSLFNYAMPFIRYAVGDIGIPSDEECPCGRTLPLMKMVEGREDSFIFLSDGRVLSPMALNAVYESFKFHNQIYQYRIIQRKIDLIEFVIKMSSDCVDEGTVEKELLVHLRRTLNISADTATFEVKFVEKFPLDKSGKVRKVVSELNLNSLSKH